MKLNKNYCEVIEELRAVKTAVFYCPVADQLFTLNIKDPQFITGIRIIDQLPLIVTVEYIGEL
jgi:hypothetical protein